MLFFKQLLVGFFDSDKQLLWHFYKVFVHSTSDCDGDTSREDFSLSFDQSQSVDHSQITSTSKTNYTIVLKLIGIFLKFLFIRRRTATATPHVKISR